MVRSPDLVTNPSALTRRLPGGSTLPTYEYVCRSCDSHLEVVQRFDDQPLAECPACGGALRKVFGSIGIAFKGSGFYKTDSRVSAKKAGGSSSKADGAADNGKGSASSGGAETGGGSDKASSNEGGKGGGKEKPAKEPKSSGSGGSAPTTKTA
ncbi:MAG: FmdB family zinc ribbon protein [Acidimicrobiales bacterium]